MNFICQQCKQEHELAIDYYAGDTAECSTCRQPLVPAPKQSAPPVTAIHSDQTIAEPSRWRKREDSSGKHDMIVGGLWFFGGIAVTAVTYASANSPEGGSYVVAWGAIVFGGIQFFKGVFRWIVEMNAVRDAQVTPVRLPPPETPKPRLPNQP